MLAALLTYSRLARQRDRLEKDALVHRHLDARRKLQQQIRNAESFRPGDTNPKQPIVPAIDAEQRRLAARIRCSPEAVLDVLTDKQECFTQQDIVRGLEKYIQDPQALNKAIKQVLASKELVTLAHHSQAHHPQTQYSTREMQAVKAEIGQQATAMQATTGHGISRKHQDALNKHNHLLQKSAGASLSMEQRTAIAHVLGDAQLSIAVGLAGTGKSTMLAAAHDAWQQQGRRVFGAAISGKAAEGLQTASGIESRTLASWQLSWKNDYHQLQKGDIFVIDEAGMIGNRQMLTFIEHVKQKQVKLVLVGDPEQLQPINAGTPFRDMTENIPHATLNEIHRQKQDWQKQAALDLANRRTDAAIDAYEKQGAVYRPPEPGKAVSTSVEDYIHHLDTHGENASRIALTWRRKDVHSINQSIRAARQERGELTREQEFSTDHGLRKFAADDRILFTRNDKTLDVRNGSFATVKTVRDKAITVEFDADTGSDNGPRRLTFKPGEYTAFDHGYAATIHKSQGITRRSVLCPVCRENGSSSHLCRHDPAQGQCQALY